MALKQELITRLIFTLAFVLIAGKIFGPILRLFWESLTGHKKKNHADLDVMIERQKQLMRKDLPKQKSSSPHPQSTPIKTVEAYNEHFRKLSASNSKNKSPLEDMKKIIFLLDNLQWGEGAAYATIVQKVKKDLDIEIPQENAFKAFKEMIRKDFLLSTDTLPSYDQILRIVEVKILLETVIQESCQNKGKLLALMAKNNHILPKDVIKAVTTLVYSPKTSNRKKIQEQVLEEKLSLKKEKLTELENNIFLLLKSDDHRHFRTKDDLFKEIASSALFFSTLSPLSPPKDKDDLARALEIFRANDETPLEKIKKRYKELASQKHPDKLSSLGIPPKFEAMATENFAIIQQAYDIILEKHNKQ